MKIRQETLPNGAWFVKLYSGALDGVSGTVDME